MKLKNTMLVVNNIDNSVAFYKKVLGLHIIMDFGGNNFELYFEEDDFDKFYQKLIEMDIDYVHPVKEHSWGQRYDSFSGC